LGFLCVVSALLIVFASPTLFPTISLLLSTIIVGEISLFWVLFLFILLIIVEFLMFISIIFFSIILAYKSKEKKVLRSFLITALLSFVSITILSIFMIIVLLINGIDLSSTSLVLTYNTFISIILTGIIVYISLTTLYFFFAKKELNKGVDVD